MILEWIGATLLGPGPGSRGENANRNGCVHFERADRPTGQSQSVISPRGTPLIKLSHHVGRRRSALYLLAAMTASLLIAPLLAVATFLAPQIYIMHTAAADRTRMTGRVTGAGRGRSDLGMGANAEYQEE